MKLRDLVFPVLRCLAMTLVLPFSSGHAATLHRMLDLGGPEVAQARAFLGSSTGRQAARSAAADSFEPYLALGDPQGGTHVRLSRRHQGLEVINGDVIAHRTQGHWWVDTTLRSPISVSVQPVMDAAAAGLATIRASGPDHGAVVGAAKLCIYNRRAESVARLAWDVSLVNPKGHAVGFFIVDARTLEILEQDDGNRSLDYPLGIGSTYYAGPVTLHGAKTAESDKRYRLQDESRDNTFVGLFNGSKRVQPATNRINAWGDYTLADPLTIAADAMYVGNVAWDYFTKFWDPVPHPNYAVVHDSSLGDAAVAAYNSNCNCIRYRDGGTSKGGYGPAASLDIGGHEYTHAIEAHFVGTDGRGFAKHGESWALSEGGADIGGTAIEFAAANNQQPGNYSLGERVFANGVGARNMYRPSDSGGSDCWYPGVGLLDGHESGGVLDHFFYLLAVGSNNQIGLPTTFLCQSTDEKVASVLDFDGSIKGIGNDRAALVWFAAIAQYMFRDSTLHDAREATINTARQYFGNDPDVAYEVIAAWNAVNVAGTVLYADFDAKKIPPQMTFDSDDQLFQPVQGWETLGVLNGLMGEISLFSGSMRRICKNQAGGLGSMTMTFKDLPKHNYLSLAFLLAAIDSLDGSAANSAAPDGLKITLDDNDVRFDKTFSNIATEPQSYRPPDGAELARIKALGFGRGELFNDSAYYMGYQPKLVNIAHTADTARIVISEAGAGIETCDNESFGFDNVRVVVSLEKL